MSYGEGMRYFFALLFLATPAAADMNVGALWPPPQATVFERLRDSSAYQERRDWDAYQAEQRWARDREAQQELIDEMNRLNEQLEQLRLRR